MQTHHRTCNLCEAHCGILIDTEDGVIGGIRGDKNDPASRGYICPKAMGLKDLYEDPDRICRPMIRRGAGDDDWQAVGWDEAIEVAAAGLHAAQVSGGNDAVGSYVGNPTAHNLMAIFGLSPFLKQLGSHNRYSASTVDQFPKMLACYLMYGAQLSVPLPDIDRTDYLMILGANPLVSNGSLMTAPGMRGRLRALKERGGRLVVIDPRRSQTADVASEHVFIRPGSDSYFLAAMINVIFQDGLATGGEVEDRIDGFDHVGELVKGFSPEAVAEITGIEAAVTRRLAHEFAEASSSSCYSRIGTCVQSYGTLASYLSDVLNIVCGRMDVPGGIMFAQPAAPFGSGGTYKRWTSRVRGLMEFGGELPVACLAEEIETGGDGQIRAMLTVAGNPVLSTPDGKRLDKALGGLDFMVSVDPALNETTRHARVLLPPRHSLENHHYSLIFHKLAIRDTVKLCKPVFEPEAESLSEFEIMGRLSAALTKLRNEDRAADGQEPLAEAGGGIYAMNPLDILEMMISGGPYDITMADLEAAPSGIDLGELKPGGLGREIRHEDSMVHLKHECIDNEVARLASDLEDQAIAGVSVKTGRSQDNNFLLIGRRQLRSNNSWMHNCPALMKGRERCTLIMSAVDADRLGLKDGRSVAVRSRVGEVEIELRVSDEIMPGVVSMPHGFGHSRPGTRMRVAGVRPGVSMNDLTDPSEVEGLVGNAILTGVPVCVSARERAIA